MIACVIHYFVIKSLGIQNEQLLKRYYKKFYCDWHQVYAQKSIKDWKLPAFTHAWGGKRKEEKTKQKKKAVRFQSNWHSPSEHSPTPCLMVIYQTWHAFLGNMWRQKFIDSTKINAESKRVGLIGFWPLEILKCCFITWSIPSDTDWMNLCNKREKK